MNIQLSKNFFDEIKLNPRLREQLTKLNLNNIDLVNISKLELENIMSKYDKNSIIDFIKNTNFDILYYVGSIENKDFKPEMNFSVDSNTILQISDCGNLIVQKFNHIYDVDIIICID